jgi:hypothetical protein
LSLWGTYFIYYFDSFINWVFWAFFFDWYSWGICFAISAAHRGDVVTGTVSIDPFDAFILFDSGASFSFVSKAFVDHMGISIQ